ncbi:MAG TPA: class I SAM-dependent methyltransferase [Thermomicrobiales bacterium]|nr:class I SAM-dependent methyltransferase [Thermomicrobiales bacterium]
MPMANHSDDADRSSKATNDMTRYDRVARMDMARGDASVRDNRQMTQLVDVDEHVERERQRYNAQFQPYRQGHLRVKYGAEFAPSDQRAALLYALDQLGDLRGKRVLEIGGGTGYHAAILVHRGAQVVATDVSSVGVEVMQRRFEANEMTDRAEAAVVVAEEMPFEDGSFDAVFGVAVLHHLVMDSAGPEIARVLRKGGRAVFLEPLSENPVLDFVRDRVPYPGKKSPHGHRGVTFAMLEQASHSFASIRIRPFYLTSMLNRALGQSTSITPLEKLDDMLIARSTRTHRLCRQVVVTFATAP